MNISVYKLDSVIHIAIAYSSNWLYKIDSCLKHRHTISSFPPSTSIQASLLTLCIVAQHQWALQVVALEVRTDQANGLHVACSTGVHLGLLLLLLLWLGLAAAGARACCEGQQQIWLGDCMIASTAQEQATSGCLHGCGSYLGQPIVAVAMAKLRLQQVVVGRRLWLRLRWRRRQANWGWCCLCWSWGWGCGWCWGSRWHGRACARGRCFGFLHALRFAFHFSLATRKKQQQQQQQTNKENFSADASLLESISKSDSDSHSHGGALGTWLPATDSCLQQLTNVDCLNWPRGGAFNPELPRKNHGIKIISAASTLRSALCSTLRCARYQKSLFSLICIPCNCVEWQ